MILPELFYNPRTLRNEARGFRRLKGHGFRGESRVCQRLHAALTRNEVGALPKEFTV